MKDRLTSNLDQAFNFKVDKIDNVDKVAAEGDGGHSEGGAVGDWVALVESNEALASKATTNKHLQAETSKGRKNGRCPERDPREIGVEREWGEKGSGIKRRSVLTAKKTKKRVRRKQSVRREAGDMAVGARDAGRGGENVRVCGRIWVEERCPMDVSRVRKGGGKEVVILSREETKVVGGRRERGSFNWLPGKVRQDRTRDGRQKGRNNGKGRSTDRCFGDAK